MGPQAISAVEISLHMFSVPRVPAQSLDAVLSFTRTARTTLATDIRFTPPESVSKTITQDVP